jgi:hypothetical protein
MIRFSLAMVALLLASAGCGVEEHKYPVGAVFRMQPEAVSHMTLEIVGYDGPNYKVRMYNNGYLLKFPGGDDTSIWTEALLEKDARPAAEPIVNRGVSDRGWTSIEMPAGATGVIRFNEDGSIKESKP